MHASDEMDMIVRPAPRTTTVLVFLAAFAITASYLAIYAIPNTLMASNMMSGFPAGADPRPRWMLNAFCISFAAFGVAALFFRWMSNRQFRRIDAIADVEG